MITDVPPTAGGEDRAKPAVAAASPARISARSWAGRAGLAAFALLCVMHLYFATVGWTHGWLPGHEFRQAQTALSAEFIQHAHTFALAYPTPVLGKPWEIPMEFPLYQWAVVALSDHAHLPLVVAARTVTLLCFYLALPALYLLLRSLGVDRRSGLLALGFILCAPLYIFYSRAFLIESMALMLSLWFLLGFTGFIKRGDRRWMLLALVAGSAAGLAKVTTFGTYLLAGAAWMTWQLRTSEPNSRWLQLRRALLVTVPPLVLALAWIVYSDLLKQQNPGADFLLSGPQSSFSFGPLSLRFTAEFWRGMLGHWRAALAPVAVLVAAPVAAAIWGRRSGAIAFSLFGVFLTTQLVFAHVHLLHDYYFYADAAIGLAAVGVAFGALLERTSNAPTVRWLLVGSAVGAMAIQLAVYRRDFLPSQQLDIPGGGEHTVALRQITAPDDVIVVVGNDWSSIIPYYSDRRALMIPSWRSGDDAYLDQAFAALRGERVGAFVLAANLPNREQLLERAEYMLGIVPTPAFAYRHDLLFYFHEELQDRLFPASAMPAYNDLTIVREPPPPSPYPWHEVVVASLADTAPFETMHPRPLLMRTPLAKPETLWVDGIARCNAHAPSELVFACPPGHHRFRTDYGLPSQTYGHASGPNTDGVQFSVLLRRSHHADQLIARVWLDPQRVAADRGVHVFDLHINAPQAATVVLQAFPGPANDNAYDWAYWGNVHLE